MNRGYYILFLLILNNIASFSQKINLQKYSAKDGLIQSTVKCIEEDDFGNLWLATNGGLSKFNGKNFENFTTVNHLPSNEITSLLYAKEILLIGTSKGLSLFNGREIIFDKVLSKIRGSVKKICLQNNAFHILSSKGYYILNVNNSFYLLDSLLIPKIIEENPTDLEFDEDGNIWISTEKKGIFFLEKNISTKIPKFILNQNVIDKTTINSKNVRVINFTSKNLFKNDKISSIEFDQKGSLLASEWNNGLVEINFNLINSLGFKANHIQLDLNENSYNNTINFSNIHKDNEGNIYLASDDYGFIVLPIDKNTNETNYNEIVYVNINQGFYDNNPLCFKKDKFNNLWVGTLNSGLISISNNSSISYNRYSGLTEEKVISLFNASDSALWVGTYSGGAFKYFNNQFTRCFKDNGLSGSIVNSIIEDQYGNTIISCLDGGINIVPNKKSNKKLVVAKVLSINNGLSSNHASYLYKSNDGAIWVGYKASDKFDRIKLNQDFSFTITSFQIPGLSKSSVSCILEDNDDNIWITSKEGVWVLNLKTGKADSRYDGFANIVTIAKDWNGNMWLGSSDKGIYILKNKLKVRYFDSSKNESIENISIKSGLISNCINSMLFDEQSVWVISNNGISELKIDAYLNRITEFKAYNKGQGFASYDNKPNTAVFDDNKFIWIGSADGLTKYQNTFDPKIEEKKLPISTFINSILIENKLIDWSNQSLFKSGGEYASIKFDSCSNWNNIPHNLILDYAHNSIVFILNTDNIIDQKQINYTYKLIGYDKDYIQLFSFNEINYRNLPDGEYKLLVKASLNSDFSDAKEFAYSFTVIAPFWKTRAFYIITILSLGLALFFLMKIRERRLKREKMKLEIIVKSRTSEIERKRKEIELQNTLMQNINNDLMDSIKYAERIQKTILPGKKLFERYFSESFVFYKPRNIVSGDYYWIRELNGLVYVAVVDCTGHGVPGAFLSLISNSILNEAIDKNIENISPAAILRHLRQEITKKLNQNTDDDQINDGLDISLICYNKENGIINYVNANRPMCIISNNQLVTLPSESFGIGGFSYSTNEIPVKSFSVKKDDLLFMFTDGITDQFGGNRNKKYNPARLRQFFLLNNHLSLADLKSNLVKEISEWQGELEQTDDILLIGLKI